MGGEPTKAIVEQLSSFDSLDIMMVGCGESEIYPVN